MINRFYENYWSDKDGHLNDFKIKWPKLKKFIPLEREITIVDFGCGKGEILREIEHLNPNANLIGIDVSDKALEQAKKILPHQNFYREESGEIPLEDKSADFVFSSEVIEHIYDTERAFSEIARILKPGGKLLLTTPYHGFIKNLLITLFAFDRHFNPTGPHVRFFSKKSLFCLLRKFGFEILEYGYYGRFWPIPHSIYVLAKISVD